MFTLRPLNESDYDNILLGWWADWGWVAPMRDLLPQDGIGGVITLRNENSSSVMPAKEVDKSDIGGALTLRDDTPKGSRSGIYSSFAPYF